MFIIIMIIIIGLIALPRLSVGLGSVRGRKFAPNPKVKGHILGACLLYDMFVVVLLFAPLLLKMFLVKPVCSRCFRKFLVTTLSAEMTNGYISVVKLPDMFDFQGQIFIFCYFFIGVVGQMYMY